MFGVAVAWYLFLAGAGSGVFLAAYCLDSALLRSGEASRTVRATVVFGYAAGFAMVAVGSLFLLSDLGRPERFSYVFFKLSSSVITFGAFSIALFLAGSFAQLLVRVIFKPQIPVAVHSALRGACAVFATAVLLYTGFLLESWDGVHFWDSMLLPFLFGVSGLSCGVSLIRIGGLLSTGGRFDLSAAFLRKSSRVEVGLLLLEAFLLFIYLGIMWYDAGAIYAVDVLLKGSLAHCFWVGVVLVGLLVPLGVSVASSRQGAVGRIAVALCALAGSYCMRYCILFAAFI